MTPYFSDGQVTLYQGHVLDVLRELPSESVQCVVTSPPYWSLRAYGTEAQVWGGDPGHAHTFDGTITRYHNNFNEGFNERWGNAVGERKQEIKSERVASTETCPCGSWRGELGHEPTPQMFVQHLVEVFREVRRVLKSDGVCFVNLGDAMGGSGKGPTGKTSINTLGTQEQRQGFSDRKTDGGVKPKSLALIPERFALAMADDGWYVRSRIAWCKRAPMPEIVRDRPTSAWEHVWLFSKSASYFWDQDAVREKVDEVTRRAATFRNGGVYTSNRSYDNSAADRSKDSHGDGDPSIGRNMWSYWLLSPDPEPLAHFATYPRELVRRCIAAATSERGECPRCGKSWVRVTEQTPEYIEWANREKANGGWTKRAGDLEHGRGTNGSGTNSASIPPKSTTTGWALSCACNAGPPVPSIVLDPFVGSGTTTMVARSMLRRSIGIDLSEEYLRTIALKKNAQMALMAPVVELGA